MIFNFILHATKRLLKGRKIHLQFKCKLDAPPPISVIALHSLAKFPSTLAKITKVKREKSLQKSIFQKLSFLNELERIEIFIVMCPSIFFPTPLPPGHLRVQSRGGLVGAVPWGVPRGHHACNPVGTSRGEDGQPKN